MNLINSGCTCKSSTAASEFELGTCRSERSMAFSNQGSTMRDKTTSESRISLSNEQDTKGSVRWSRMIWTMWATFRRCVEWDVAEVVDVLRDEMDEERVTVLLAAFAWEETFDAVEIGAEQELSESWSLVDSTSEFSWSSDKSSRRRRERPILPETRFERARTIQKNKNLRG